MIQDIYGEVTERLQGELKFDLDETKVNEFKNGENISEWSG